MRSEAFDWKRGEAGLAWRQVTELPRRRGPARPFLLGMAFTVLLIVVLAGLAVR